MYTIFGCLGFGYDSNCNSTAFGQVYDYCEKIATNDHIILQ